MPRKLKFGPGSKPKPKPLKIWKPKGRKAPVLLHVLPVKDFKAAAIKHGIPPEKGGFAVWGRWWKRDEIYLRADQMALLGHEWRHIEEQGNFHEQE